KTGRQVPITEFFRIFPSSVKSPICSRRLRAMTGGLQLHQLHAPRTDRPSNNSYITARCMHLHQYSFSGWSCAEQRVYSCTGESTIQHETRKICFESQNPTTLENVPHVLLGNIVCRSDVDVANAPSHEEACKVTRDLKPSSTRLPRQSTSWLAKAAKPPAPLPTHCPPPLDPLRRLLLRLPLPRPPPVARSR
ncbi:unnamed protein product, partial [Ectocarpus sp. 13 AM-2016]